MLSLFHRFSDLILIITLQDRYYHLYLPRRKLET